LSLLLVAAPLAVLTSATAEAAPKADLVVVWAPGMKTAPVEAAAKKAGAAFVNSSPPPEASARTAEVVLEGIAAFDALELDKAWQLLEQARSEAVRTGGAGLSRARLSDLFLYRGLIKLQQSDASSAWEELVASATIDPSRQLDPAKFAPKVVAELDRARETVNTKPRVNLKIDAAAGCSVYVDGVPSPGTIQLPVGSHWINGSCPDSRPDGYRLELTGEMTFPFHPPPYPLPNDSDVLAQARVAGHGLNSFISIEVRSGVATARLVGIDGRERDRKTVKVENGDLTPVGDALLALLVPPPPKHWYKSKWTYAGAGALAAALIAIPVTLVLTANTDPTSASSVPDFNGMPPW
jgi:hypothetical protein